MKKVNRNNFTQAGAKVQKIDQGGTWAVIQSSYFNEHLRETDCETDFLRKYGTNFVSIARWIYRCTRVVKKKDSVIQRLPNGEILHPCFNIEPYSHVRLSPGTLVWLEPLPQLNGFVIIPGGKPEFPECLDEYGYGSKYKGYSSGGDLTSCLDCLSRLCVVRNSSGHIIDIFYMDKDGNMVRVLECGSSYPASSGDTDCNNCKPPLGAPYQFEYNITYGGDNYVGIEGPDENLESLSGYFTDPCVGWYWETSGFGYMPRLQGPNCYDGYPPLFYAGICCTDGRWTFNMNIICPGKPPCFLYEDDFDVSVTNCSPGPPTFAITIKPGRCAQGYIVIRPQ